MIWLISIITIFGFASGIYSFVKISKVMGIVELILAALCLIMTILFSSLQNERVFGGTKWEFFCHSATVDGDIWPWIIFIVLIVEIVFVVRTVYIIAKKE